MNRKGPALFSRIRRSRSAGSCSIIKETVSCNPERIMKILNNLGRNISRDIVSEEWNRANLGGYRARDKQLFAFEVALLIADELTT